jgi:hypothetical protein
MLGKVFFDYTNNKSKVFMNIRCFPNTLKFFLYMSFAIRNLYMITFGGIINKHLYMKTIICSNECKGRIFFYVKDCFSYG